MELKFANPLKRSKKASKQAPGQPLHHTVSSGSSYSSKGVLPPPDTSGSEQGSSRPVVIQELVPELSSAYSRQVAYTQMLNDSTCDVSMRVVKTPVLGAEFYVDPVSNDQINLDVADFVCDNLFEGMTDPLLVSMANILSFCEDGWSVLQKVYENREWTPNGTGRNSKTYTMLKTLAPRPSNTMAEITYDDNGHVTAINQNAINGSGQASKVALDINKLLIFTLNKKGGDITGKSLLRTAYVHWYYKVHMYKIDAIQKERHALGVPRGKLLPGYTAADKVALRMMLRNIRANEEAFIIQTPNVEVDFAEVNTQLIDVMKSADHHNSMILLNVLAAFIALGITEGGGGSRATGATQADIFMKSLRYLANLICDVININLIPELVIYNFPVTEFPKLRVRNIGETQDLQKLSSAISNLFSQQAITGDEDTENWLRRVFDMPLKKQGATVTPNAQTDPNAATPDPTGKGSVQVNGRDVAGGNNGKAAIGAAN